MREANEGWAAFVVELVRDRYAGNASAFAKTLDVSTSTVTRWIDGATPEIARLKQLSRTENIPMLHLLRAAGALDDLEEAAAAQADSTTPAETTPDVVDAIERSDLVDRAKQHLLNQYELLRELSDPAANKRTDRPPTPAVQRPLRAVARKRPPRRDQP